MLRSPAAAPRALQRAHEVLFPRWLRGDLKKGIMGAQAACMLLCAWPGAAMGGRRVTFGPAQMLEIEEDTAQGGPAPQKPMPSDHAGAHAACAASRPPAVCLCCPALSSFAGTQVSPVTRSTSAAPPAASRRRGARSGSECCCLVKRLMRSLNGAGKAGMGSATSRWRAAAAALAVGGGSSSTDFYCSAHERAAGRRSGGIGAGMLRSSCIVCGAAQADLCASRLVPACLPACPAVLCCAAGMSWAASPP